jgi:glycosyltransferase involved in cell wall biosynthesis
MPDDLERLPGDPENIYRVPWKSWRIHQRDSKVDQKVAKQSQTVQRSIMIRNLRRFASVICQNLFEFPDVCHTWIKPAVEYGATLARKTPFDLIYSSSGTGVSAHFVASKLKKILNIPWVHEYRDLWAGNPWRDTIALPWRDGRERRWERRFLTQADRAICMNEGNAKILAARGPIGTRSRVFVVPNGFDADEFSKDVPIPQGFPLRLCYTGSLYGGKRDLGGLFGAFRLLMERREVSKNEVQFMYAGESSALVQALAEREGVKELIVDRGFVSGSAAKDMQQASHVLVLAEAADDDPWIMGNMPAKAYEYLGAARPVLALAHPAGAIAQLLEETHAGRTFRPDDSAGVAAYLSELVGALRQNGRVPFTSDAVAVSRHSWQERSALLAGLLDSVLAGSGKNPGNIAQEDQA